MNKVRRCLERRAYGAIGREIEALSRLGTIRAHHIERRREAKRALSTAQRQCAEAIERFDVFDAAMAQLRGAIECVDVLTGELHRPEQVEALIEQAANTLDSMCVSARSWQSICVNKRVCCPSSKHWEIRSRR